MLKLGRVTKVKVLFLVLVYIFYFDLLEFSAAILEKGLLTIFESAYKNEQTRKFDKPHSALIQFSYERKNTNYKQIRSLR